MFTKKERKIFRYQRGDKTVAADPLLLTRRLRQATKDKDLDTLLKQLSLGDKESAGEHYNPLLADHAEEQLLAIAREQFRMPPLGDDSEGFTEEEVLEAFFSFLEYLEKNAGPVGDSPTSPPPSEPESCPSSGTSACVTGTTSSSG